VHPGAFEFVGRFATLDAVSVIEIGSRDINGSARAYFPNAKWTGLDLYEGPAVDWVGDAIEYSPAEHVDLVIACEVFEHSNQWPFLIHRAHHWLKPGGRIIITCAGPGRAAHSAIDGGELHPDEHYANVTKDELAEELHYAGFVAIEVSGNEHWKDTYGTAMKAPS
jgi:SAM-dependent methyltransferase